MSKYIVVPDIHGQYTIFLQIINYIKREILKYRNIKIIFLGDYINKGEAGIEPFVDNLGNLKYKFFEDIGSVRVVKEIFKLKEFFERKKIFYRFLKGNQEELFSNIRCEENPNVYENKLKNTITGFNFNINLIKKTINFFSKLPNYYNAKDDALFFVHAGINPTIYKNAKIDLEGANKEEYLWIREEFFTYSGTFPSTIIFGHTPMDNPLMLNFLAKNSLYFRDKHKVLLMKDRIGLDSRVYINRYINLLFIEDRDIKIIKIDKSGIEKEIKFLNFLPNFK